MSAQDVLNLKTLPHDLDAERSVIGALLLDQDSFADVVDTLSPKDFYSPQNEIIFDIELQLFSAAKPVDSITVVDALSKAGVLEKVGGREFIADLAANVISTANVTYYANIVKEHATLRNIIAAGVRIQQVGHTTEGRDAKNAIDIAESEVFALSHSDTNQDYVSLREGLGAAKDIIRSAQSSNGLDGVPTGLKMLDNHFLHGLKPGQMVVVAARPGVGKSTLALDIARKAAIGKKIPTIIFNLEMAYPEILLRLIAAEKEIDHGNLQNGRLSDGEWQRIEQFERSLLDSDGNEIPLFIDDSANISLMQIRTKSRRLFSKFDKGIGLIIVDYLQLMSSGMRVESRQQEVADMSRKLKLLAKELGVPIIAISQLNRGSETRGDKRPQLSDLRESGAIEQDADVVILVHREEMYHNRDDDDEKARRGEADIIVAKNRAGRTGDFEVLAQLQYSRFENKLSDI
ncbi:MAG: replicative DNA helicase [Candidatus Ancillula sp.]|jgi:replicative DNA helicase|nr:replicative DNA helicase [Candidatus Ancillula sp.]